MTASRIKLRHDFNHVRETVLEVEGISGNVAKAVDAIDIHVAGGPLPAEVTIKLHLPVIDFEGLANVQLVLTDEQRNMLEHFGWFDEL